MGFPAAIATRRRLPLAPITVLLLIVLVMVAGRNLARFLSLQRQQQQEIALAAAVEQNDAAGVKAALTAGADPDVRILTLYDTSSSAFPQALFGPRRRNTAGQPTQGTPLVWASGRLPSDLSFVANAAPKEHLEIVRALLDAGADLNGGSFAQKSPLTAAVEATHPQTVRLLLEHGANVNSRDRMGSTPLMAAMLTSGPGALEIVRLLLEKGADANARTYPGMTPLMFAAQYENPEYVSLLLKHGAEANTRDVTGKTALSFLPDSNPTNASHSTSHHNKAAEDFLAVRTKRARTVKHLLRQAGATK